jgi:DNA-binding CsgD family transcriptional regulator
MTFSWIGIAMGAKNKLKPDIDIRNTGALLGIAFPFTWLSLSAQLSEELYLASHVGQAVALLLGLLLSMRTGAKQEKRRFGLEGAAALLMIVPLGFSSFENLLPSIIVWFLGGFGLGWHLIRWFANICQLKQMRAVSIILLAFAIAACFHWLFLFLPASGSLAFALILAAIACLSFLFLFFTEKRLCKICQPEDACDSDLPSPKKGFIALLIIAAFLFAEFFGIARLFLTILDDSLPAYRISLILQAVLPIILLIWLWARTQGLAKSRGFRSLLLIIALTACFIIFIDRGQLVFLIGLQQLARDFVIISIYLVLIVFIKRDGMPTTRVFCLGYGIFESGLISGAVLWKTPVVLNFFTVFPPEGIYLITACLFVLLAYVLVVIADFYRERQRDKVSTLVLESESIKLHCAELGKQYALAPREIEIIELFCQGRSRGYVAETLYLSQNTVKWYASQIYKKLKIHNRQELLTMVGMIESGSSGRTP